MATQGSSPWRVFGLWLLYVFVGLFVLLLALGSSSPGLDDTKQSPTGWAAKLVSASCALPLVAAGLGWYVLRTPTGNQPAGQALLVGGLVVGVVLTGASWALIARDLRTP